MDEIRLLPVFYTSAFGIEMLYIIDNTEEEDDTLTFGFASEEEQRSSS